MTDLPQFNTVSGLMNEHKEMQNTSSAISIQIERLSQPKRRHMPHVARNRYGKETVEIRSRNFREMSKDSSVDSFMRGVLNNQQNGEYQGMFDDQTPGPDTYNALRDLIAKKQQVVSRYKNVPSFPVFSRSDKHNKTIITGNHKADQLGQDSPGVGLYDTSAEKFYKFKKQHVSPGLQSFSKTRRFKSTVAAHIAPNRQEEPLTTRLDNPKMIGKFSLNRDMSSSFSPNQTKIGLECRRNTTNLL